ncbi:hypothetical protein GOB57_21915 [Sinorhizobium meliloti]|nr:hypothetical protein [Sinorhizobium meliloti]
MRAAIGQRDWTGRICLSHPDDVLLCVLTTSILSERKRPDAAYSSARETQCFRGGDRSHRTEIENTKNQMNTCFEWLASIQ